MQWKLSDFPVTISACRKTAPLASWMFSLRKLKSHSPTWVLLQRQCQHNQFSWAGSIASISEEALQHSAACCLMKQVAVVIKKPVLPYRFGHGSHYGPLHSEKSRSCYRSGMVSKPWSSASKVMQCFGDLAKAQARMAGLSINVDQDSAIFLSALQNKAKIAEKNIPNAIRWKAERSASLAGLGI